MSYDNVQNINKNIEVSKEINDIKNKDAQALINSY